METSCWLTFDSTTFSSSFLMTGGSKTGGNLNSFFNSGFSDFGEVSYSVDAVYSFVSFVESVFSIVMVFSSLIYNSFAFIFSSYSFTLISNSYTIYFWCSSSISLSLILYDLPSSLTSSLFSVFSSISLLMPSLFLLESLGTWRWCTFFFCFFELSFFKFWSSLFSSCYFF